MWISSKHPPKISIAFEIHTQSPQIFREHLLKCDCMKSNWTNLLLTFLNSFRRDLDNSILVKAKFLTTTTRPWKEKT